MGGGLEKRKASLSLVSCVPVACIFRLKTFAESLLLRRRSVYHTVSCTSVHVRDEKPRLIEDRFMGPARGHTTTEAEPALKPSSSFSVRLVVANLSQIAQGLAMFRIGSPVSQETPLSWASRDRWSP